jgi:hypothetical protein
LQTQILAAQQGALAANILQAQMAEKIGQLEKEVASLKAWATEKERYELKDIGLGTIAYLVKEGVRGTEPVHQICAACYQHGKKSILQPRDIGMDRLLNCPECNTQFKIGNLSFGSSGR